MGKLVNYLKTKFELTSQELSVLIFLISILSVGLIMQLVDKNDQLTYETLRIIEKEVPYNEVLIEEDSSENFDKENRRVDKENILNNQEKKKNKEIPKSKININTATKDELLQLPGIGEKTADLIIEYRKKNGLFNTVDDIKQVKGIGEKKFEKLLPFIKTK